ncbi:MAG TPA: amphi-Trp domain-containing protein [Flavobacteriaceae bacterium]|nr:amphi-Trp domain-containing protein [Flavobacteriaceae bacterium]
MGKEIVLIKNEEKMSRQEAVKMLRTIADKLEEGKITLSQGNKEVTLVVPERVEVEIKAEKEEKRRKTTKKLEVEIEWLVDGTDQASGGLEIT